MILPWRCCRAMLFHTVLQLSGVLITLLNCGIRVMIHLVSVVFAVEVLQEKLLHIYEADVEGMATQCLSTSWCLRVWDLTTTSREVLIRCGDHHNRNSSILFQIGIDS